MVIVVGRKALKKLYHPRLGGSLRGSALLLPICTVGETGRLSERALTAHSTERICLLHAYVGYCDHPPPPRHGRSPHRRRECGCTHNQRWASSLVLAEHDNAVLHPATLNAGKGGKRGFGLSGLVTSDCSRTSPSRSVTAAKEIGGDVDIIVLGAGAGPVVDTAKKVCCL